jgi:hypothetical protein
VEAVAGTLDMAPVITRAEAKQAGLARYFTGKPCRNGHISERFVVSKSCIACRKEMNWKYNQNWYYKNRDKKLAYDKEKRKARIEHYRAKKREWQKDNLWRARASVAKRSRAEKLATPKWAKIEEIKKIYALCDTIENLTTLKHHVDHIVPLQGRNVCGLHVENNLRIILASENAKKSNKWGA